MPISVTELGITTDVRPKQREKEQITNQQTDIRITNAVSTLQPSKAAPPIEVTEFGITTEVSREQTVKA